MVTVIYTISTLVLTAAIIAMMATKALIIPSGNTINRIPKKLTITMNIASQRASISRMICIINAMYYLQVPIGITMTIMHGNWILNQETHLIATFSSTIQIQSIHLASFTRESTLFLIQR